MLVEYGPRYSPSLQKIEGSRIPENKPKTNSQNLGRAAKKAILTFLNVKPHARVIRI
jgi:hypothetical protein